MSIYIYLERPFEYVVTDSSGKEKSRGQLEGLKDVLKIKSRGPKIGVVPGQYVNIRAVGLPTNNKKKVTSILPNALENEVIGDIDSLTIRLIGPANKKVKHALVVDKTLLEEWTTAAANAGIRLDKMIPDFALTPSHETADCSLLFDDMGYVYVHEGAFYKKKIRQEFLVLWGSSKARKSDDHVEESLSDSDVSIASNDDVLLKQFGSVGDSTVVNWPIGKSWTDWVGQSHRSVAGFNLLEGEFTPDHKVEKYKGLRFSLFVCLLATVVKIGSDSYDYLRLLEEDVSLDNQIKTLFQETFPDVKRIVNPRVQMRNKISEIRNGNRSENDLLMILSLLSPVMRASNLEFDRLDYRSGELVFACLVENFSRLDHLHQRLKGVDQLDITLSSSGSLNGSISGRFTAILKRP